VRCARAPDKPRVYLGSSTLAGKQEGVAVVHAALPKMATSLLLFIIITPSPPKKYRRILISHFLFTREDGKRKRCLHFNNYYYTYNTIEKAERKPLLSPDAEGRKGEIQWPKRWL
jgi:hypothetical protein